MPSVCPTPFNISNVYPLSSPSSHWGFHVADAARRGVPMCVSLPGVGGTGRQPLNILKGINAIVFPH